MDRLDTKQFCRDDMTKKICQECLDIRFDHSFIQCCDLYRFILTLNFGLYETSSLTTSKADFIHASRKLYRGEF